MERLAVVAVLFAVSACSGGPSERLSVEGRAAENGEAPADVSFGGNVDLGQCGTQPHGARPVRCGAPGTSGAAATVCGAVAADNVLTVRSGSLVVGGDSRIASPLHVEKGSFTSFGGIEGDNTEDVDGDLTTASNWVVSAPAHVGGDAFVRGRLDARNTVQVGGTLHVAGNVSNSVSAATVTDTSVDIAQTLSCADAPDVLALADAAGRLGVLDEGRALASVSERTDVTLGCAQYRFESLGIDAELSLHVQGNTVIVVDGNVRIAAATRIEVAPGASLDFVISGSLEVDNMLSFEGAPTWLAVAGDVRFAAPTKLAGWLVAPTSEVGADNTLDVSGAIYVGSLRVASPVTVNATSAQLDACPPP